MFLIKKKCLVDEKYMTHHIIIITDTIEHIACCGLVM